MHIKARYMRKRVDEEIATIIDLIKRNTNSLELRLNDLVAFIANSPTVYAEAYTTEERTENTQMNTDLQALIDYIRVHTPPLPE